MGGDQDLRKATGGGAQVGNIHEGAVPVELAMRTGRLQGGKLHVLEFNARLETVLAENLRDVVGHLKSLADFVRRQVVVAAQGGQIGDIDGGKAAVLSQLRDALDSVLRRNAHHGAFRSEARGVEVGESRAHLVDGVGSKHVGPARHGLIGFCGLEALVEGAAIGYAAEDARNVLRVIRIAESNKYLLLLGGVEIEPHIVGVLMLEQIGARCESSQPGCRRRVEAQQLDGVGVDAAGRQLIQVAGGGKGHGAGCAGAERIARITVAGGVIGQAGNRIHCSRCNKARGGRIEDCAGHDGASQDVRSGRTSRLGEDVGEIGEAAAPFQRGGNRAGGSRALDAAQTFVIAEEEDLVLDDGAAAGHAELIHAQLALLDSAVVFKPVRGIEFIVAEKLPGRAMEAVGAGLDGGVQNRARGTAQFGAEVRCLDLEFLDRVQRRKNDKVGAVEEVDGVGVVVDAVQQVVVLRGAQAVGGECARGRIAAGVGLRRLHAGAKLGKESKVAPVERQTVHALLGDYLPDRRFFGLQQRRRG